jgi:hypothetical protein
MANEPVKIMVGGCLGGLSGAFLGVVIGGFLVSVSQESTHEVRGQHVPEMALDVSAHLVGDVFAMLMGAGIGGIIGGIGGSVLGAGLAAKASRRRTEEPPSVKTSRSAKGSEPRAESSDAELARWKERVTELETKKRRDDRFKEKGAWV